MRQFFYLRPSRPPQPFEAESHAEARRVVALLAYVLDETIQLKPDVTDEDE